MAQGEVMFVWLNRKDRQALKSLIHQEQDGFYIWDSSDKLDVHIELGDFIQWAYIKLKNDNTKIRQVKK